MVSSSFASSRSSTTLRAPMRSTRNVTRGPEPSHRDDVADLVESAIEHRARHTAGDHRRLQSQLGRDGRGRSPGESASAYEIGLCGDRLCQSIPESVALCWSGRLCGRRRGRTPLLAGTAPRSSANRFSRRRVIPFLQPTLELIGTKLITPWCRHPWPLTALETRATETD